MSDELKRRASDYEVSSFSKAELRDIFREEGQKLIDDTFSLLGVDISSQDARNKIRDDFTWLRGVRSASDEAAGIVRKVGIAAAVTFLLGAMVAGVKMSLKAMS